MRLKLLKKWKKKRAFRYIPSVVIYEPFYQTLKNFNEDIPYITEKVQISRKKVKTREKKINKAVFRLNYPLKEHNQVSRETIKQSLRQIRARRYTSQYAGLYDATFKIVLFGDIVEGRAELSQKFLTNIFASDSKITIGVDFEVKSLNVDQSRVKLQIWDLEERGRFRFLLPTYVRGSKGGLFIYNVNDILSLASIDNWLSIIRKELKETDQFPILIVGLISEIKDDHTIPAEYAIEVAKKRGANGFIECNVKTGENIEKAFEALTRLMLHKLKKK